ncbi:alpha-1,2-fucosyltransferase [Sulfuricurvum sp.]|uniref:alpha-1,2-fucosyltransferase n=1 Tax=Sulfuricurvum sp. TaxID=2025608 RepID=UPI0026180312|nr:alpha-1,2-fucosyltransferase [Sulfuricurvum sp.]MDD3597010.1 alpha-1,2-fucosyltransferase [Sulfuricurvum sp.]
MILFFADGRLGNQLFQYAFLNTIAKEGEKIFTANMEQFINEFNIHNTNYKHFAFGKYSKFFIRKLFIPFLIFCVRLKLINYIHQDRNYTSALPTFSLQRGLLPIRFIETNFFQSEIFFDADKIDFDMKTEYIIEAQEFLNKIPKDHINVFVHVRRGDYIYESFAGINGIDLPKKYFINAMKNIAKDIQNPFFIFLSDDSAFVECCFVNVDNKIISKNSMATDLAIMSLCEYGIVSNSSFSWWGAYLMQNRKKVIFPKYWYGWKSKIDSHINIQPQWAEVVEVEL